MSRPTYAGQEAFGDFALAVIGVCACCEAQDSTRYYLTPMPLQKRPKTCVERDYTAFVAPGVLSCPATTPRFAWLSTQGSHIHPYTRMDARNS